MGTFRFDRVELLRPLGDSGLQAAHATSTIGTELVVVDPVTDPAALARARALVDASHPHLAAVRDVGSDRVLSEFVDGERLDRLGNIPLEIALRIAIDILAALGAMHAYEIVHGNV